MVMPVRLHPVALTSFYGKPSPAAPDLKDMIFFCDPGLFNNTLNLIVLSIFQAFVFRPEDPAGICHGLVQEGPIEVGTQIVMSCNVLLAADNGVGS